MSKWWAALTGSLLLSGCGIPEEQYVRKVNEAEQLRQDLEGTRGQVRAVGKENQALREALQEREGESDTLGQDLGSARARVEELENALAARGRQITELTSRVVELEEERASLSAKQRRLLEEKRALEAKTQEFDSLVDKMKDEIAAGQVEITNLQGRMAVKLTDKVLFASGSARIQTDGEAALRKLAEVLRSLDNKAMRVEGHTDNVPVNRGGPFASNWELSSARAMAVVRFLQSEGVDPSRLSAEGCGQYRPIADNETPEGRSQNRRIEIVLVPLQSR